MIDATNASDVTGVNGGQDGGVPPPASLSLPLREDHERKRLLGLERRKEYNEFLNRVSAPCISFPVPHSNCHRKSKLTIGLAPKRNRRTKKKSVSAERSTLAGLPPTNRSSTKHQSLTSLVRKPAETATGRKTLPRTRRKRRTVAPFLPL